MFEDGLALSVGMSACLTDPLKVDRRGEGKVGRGVVFVYFGENVKSDPAKRWPAHQP